MSSLEKLSQVDERESTASPEPTPISEGDSEESDSEEFGRANDNERLESDANRITS